MDFHHEVLRRIRSPTPATNENQCRPVQLKEMMRTQGHCPILIGRRLALPWATTYVGSVVKQPLINVEEKIDRVVGQRTPAADSLKTGMQLQSLGVELHTAFKHRWCPKGVYRFKTHEEADAWMIKMLARSGMSKT